MALHYTIAYPRMHHFALSGGGDVKNVLPPAPKVGGGLDKLNPGNP
jgi:hypothetical protein